MTYNQKPRHSKEVDKLKTEALKNQVYKPGAPNDPHYDGIASSMDLLLRLAQDERMQMATRVDAAQAALLQLGPGPLRDELVALLKANR